MAKHWRDQFMDKGAAKAAEEDRRVARSEGWQGASDPGPNARAGGRSIQLGQRSSSPTRPRLERDGPSGAGINIRVGGGATFELAGKDEEAKAPAPEVSQTAPEPVQTPGPAPAQPKAESHGLVAKLTGLFGRNQGEE